MKKNIYLFVSFCMYMIGSIGVKAQCPAGRYLDDNYFPAYTVDSNVIYSDTYPDSNHTMNIYLPTGDTMAHRPVIILAHGGSFISGNATDDYTIVEMCQAYALRGYVTVSINYRLTSILNMLDSVDAITEVAQAMSDGKAAIRYFVKDAATANTYKIDTDNIFIGGNSAGAVLYLHVGYIDSIGECPAYLQTIFNNNGGFEGNSGNAGYTTKFKAVVSLAGGLNMTSFISPGDVPSANAQGSADNVVPYYCGHPDIGITVPVTLCGLGSMEPVYDSNNIYHVSHVFPGQGHVPWDDTTAAAQLMYDTVDNMVKQFLYTLVCNPNYLSVNPVNAVADVSLYPNPAYDVINLKSSQIVTDLQVYDITGRIVAQVNDIHTSYYQINTSNLTAGVYFVKVRFGYKDDYEPLIRKVVIE